MISFVADERNVVIDGRDFLPVASREILAETFGPCVVRYADRARATSGDELIACCDLARQDCPARIHGTPALVLPDRIVS